MNRPRNVDNLMHQAFATPRDPRSEEYKAGVRAVLKLRLQGVAVECPYVSLVQRDAFFAGCQEGHQLAREHLERKNT